MLINGRYFKYNERLDDDERWEHKQTQKKDCKFLFKGQDSEWSK